MSEISSAMIKDLRERTGVGMSKCKDALVRADGSIDKAIEILRKEGMASSVKKEGRETKDGFIDFAQTDDAIALIELNSETDFVAQNERFKFFLADLCNQSANTRPANLAELLSQKFESDESITVDEYRNILIQKFGENIQIKRMEIIEKDRNCSYGIYKHMGGKIVTIVEIEGSNDALEIAKEVAMHVAAERPDFLSPDDVDESVLEKEKDIARSQIKNKPENMIEKIVEGKMKAFYDSACLLNQKFIKDTAISVKQFVERAGIQRNLTLNVKRFWFWKIGQ
jgi:elongation factor Ts